MVGKRPLAQGYLMSIHLELHKHEVNSFIFFIIRTDDRAFLSVYLAFICFVFSPPGYVYIIFYGMLCVIAKYFLATVFTTVWFNLVFCLCSPLIKDSRNEYVFLHIFFHGLHQIIVH